MIDESDAMLVQRCLAGDTTAAETLMKRYQGYVSVIINRTGKGMLQHADVDDLRQEVWLKVFRGLGTYTERDEFRAWLARISVNATLESMRKKARDRVELFPENFDPSDASSVPGLPTEPGLSTEIEELIVRLSEREQQIIRMNYLEEMSPGEIADRLGVSTWIVYRDRRDALGKLREMVFEANDLTKG